jgi:hypothetical protein
MAANPLAILVPCHRVLADDGSLGGFAYGLELKKAVLGLEGYCGRKPCRPGRRRGRRATRQFRTPESLTR